MKRPGDTTPDPPGGRAADRLRLFEEARKSPSKKQATPLISEASGAPKTRGARKRKARHEKQDRRKA